MTPILNLHLLLEQMRVRAHHSPNDTSSDDDEQRPKPPCVLVIGPESSGKTTATKILTNYAVRSPLEWQPMLVNLDTSDVRFQARSDNVIFVSSTTFRRVVSRFQGPSRLLPSIPRYLRLHLPQPSVE